MIIPKKVGAFIDAARADNQSRPTLTFVDVSTQSVPYLPFGENQCAIAATDGYRLHVHIAQQNGATGICTLEKLNRNSYTVAPEPIMTEVRYPDYRVTIPTGTAGDWLTLTDWPDNLTAATAKGLGRAGVWATFTPRSGNFRFSGFVPAGSFSLKSRKKAGAFVVNAQFFAEALIPGDGGYQVNFKTPNRPIMVRSLSRMNWLAVIMPLISAK